MQNSVIFHSRSSDLEMANKIKCFYQEHHINLEFKSVTSYFNLKSYSFIVIDNVDLPNIVKFNPELRNYLGLRSIRIIYNHKNEFSFEVYNEERKTYDFFDAIENEKFQKTQGMLLPILLGERNGVFVTDLTKIHHLLVAGQTGAGKTIFAHSLILSLLYHNSPEILKLILIDHKVVEFSSYNNIPHLLNPVITENEEAINALSWCINEMERRYLLLSQAGVNHITQYNEKMDKKEHIPYIVIIIDEFANLMLSKRSSYVESCLVKIAQKAEATGIHLVLATQRPSVDIITNTLKENMPNRIAFTVASAFDSKTILDVDGAETLRGRGDMLLSIEGNSDVLRIQAPFISDDMIENITDKLRLLGKPTYIEFPKIELSKTEPIVDELIDEALAHILETTNANVANLQRKFHIGFDRANRIIDYLEYKGVLSKPRNGKREILKSSLS